MSLLRLWYLQGTQKLFVFFFVYQPVENCHLQPFVQQQRQNNSYCPISILAGCVVLLLSTLIKAPRCAWVTRSPTWNCRVSSTLFHVINCSPSCHVHLVSRPVAETSPDKTSLFCPFPSDKTSSAVWAPWSGIKTNHGTWLGAIISESSCGNAGKEV